MPPLVYRVLFVMQRNEVVRCFRHESAVCVHVRAYLGMAQRHEDSSAQLGLRYLHGYVGVRLVFPAK